jgi:hypothetical protein
VKNIVSPQRSKKIDVQQRDKSHVGSQRKEKHVVHLIKILKKTLVTKRPKKKVEQRDKSHVGPQK